MLRGQGIVRRSIALSGLSDSLNLMTVSSFLVSMSVLDGQSVNLHGRPDPNGRIPGLQTREFPIVARSVRMPGWARDRKEMRNNASAHHLDPRGIHELRGCMDIIESHLGKGEKGVRTCCAHHLELKTTGRFRRVIIRLIDGQARIDRLYGSESQ